MEVLDVPRIWCNARIDKASFYHRFGLKETALLCQEWAVLCGDGKNFLIKAIHTSNYLPPLQRRQPERASLPQAGYDRWISSLLLTDSSLHCISLRMTNSVYLTLAGSTLVGVSSPEIIRTAAAAKALIVFVM